MTSPIKVWREQKKITKFLGQTGKIVSFTLVRVPPVGFSTQAPYYVAIVELENKNRVIGQLVDVFDSQVNVGQKVEMVYRRLAETNNEDVIHYGIKFRLV